MDEGATVNEQEPHDDAAGGSVVDRTSLRIGLGVVAVVVVLALALPPAYWFVAQPDWVGSSTAVTLTTGGCLNVQIEEHGRHWRAYVPTARNNGTPLSGSVHFDSSTAATFRAADGTVLQFRVDPDWGDLSCAILSPPT